MNSLKRYLKPVQHSKYTSIALLLLRIIVGIAFIGHGWGKVQNPFAWAGPQSPFPAAFLLLSSITEFGGGIALLLGIFTPIASLALAINMAVATCLHALIMGDPFISTGGASYELALLYFSIAVLFLIAGPGKYSADAKLFRERK